MNVFENPQDPANKVIIVVLNKDEAKAMIQVYREYVDNHSRQKKVKDTLTFMEDHFNVY